MILNVQVRSQGFRDMCIDLARMSGRDYRDVLRSEAASSIKLAALQSPIASKADIEKQVRERAGRKWDTASGEWSVNLHKHAGRVWFWDRDGGLSRAERAAGPLRPGEADRRQIVSRGGFYLVFDAGPSRGHHVPDPVWLDYVSSRDLRLQVIRERAREIIRRRGTERLAWLQMTDAMQIDIKTVAPTRSVREDIARGSAVRGRQYHHGTARETTDVFRLSIVVENSSPVAVKRWGQRRIEDAMRRRRRAFEISMKKGLFENLTLRAKRYPGIFVLPA